MRYMYTVDYYSAKKEQNHECHLWASQVTLVVKNPPVDVGDVQRCRFDPWVGKIPERRK